MMPKGINRKSQTTIRQEESAILTQHKSKKWKFTLFRQFNKAGDAPRLVEVEFLHSNQTLQQCIVVMASGNHFPQAKLLNGNCVLAGRPVCLLSPIRLVRVPQWLLMRLSNAVRLSLQYASLDRGQIRVHFGC
ncbi:unnamed protein product [Protopolystoma xenopodis]|uniref:Uncharacterized protein n=1 Tax=Protopolystoma xenopodis TaxID=117903 RepID=A0A3S5A4S6_9PLAT|nr:unnamed protein product [Protopolystoma xenopodis]